MSSGAARISIAFAGDLISRPGIHDELPAPPRSVREGSQTRNYRYAIGIRHAAIGKVFCVGGGSVGRESTGNRSNRG